VTDGPVELGHGDLLLASTMLVLFGAVSVLGRLGLERKLAVASLRAFVQLTVLGMVLLPIFAWQSPWPVLLWCVAMGLLAGREATMRTERRYRGMGWSSVVAMAVAGGGTVLFAQLVVLRVEPWWTPRYLVPLLGMILGNALSGVSLGMDRAMSLLVERRRAIEALLALGATRQEVGRDVVREATRTGLVPILNTMSVVGLVSIPGMMTGQLLGGTPPVQAARYQFLILALIAGAVAVGTLVAVLLTVRVGLDAEHRLRVERFAGDADPR
jgi:putative ABC transport system permease protein